MIKEVERLIQVHQFKPFEVLITETRAFRPVKPSEISRAVSCFFPQVSQVLTKAVPTYESTVQCGGNIPRIYLQVTSV